MAHVDDPSRRRFVDWFLGGSVGAFLLAVLYPVSRSLRDDLVEEAVTKTRTA